MKSMRACATVPNKLQQIPCRRVRTHTHTHARTRTHTHMGVCHVDGEQEKSRCHLYSSGNGKALRAVIGQANLAAGQQLNACGCACHGGRSQGLHQHDKLAGEDAASPQERYLRCGARDLSTPQTLKKLPCLPAIAIPAVWGQGPQHAADL